MIIIFRLSASSFIKSLFPSFSFAQKKGAIRNLQFSIFFFYRLNLYSSIPIFLHSYTHLTAKDADCLSACKGQLSLFSKPGSGKGCSYLNPIPLLFLVLG